MKLLIRLGVIGIVLVGGFLMRDRLSSNPGDLKVGDCFDVPTAATDTVKSVAHHPCGDPHTAEAILIAAYPAAKGAAVPNDSQIHSFLVSTCVAALTAYAGADNSALDVGAFYPTVDGWNDGERDVTCYLSLLDGSPMTKSYKAS